MVIPKTKHNSFTHILIAILLSALVTGSGGYILIASRLDSAVTHDECAKEIEEHSPWRRDKGKIEMQLEFIVDWIQKLDAKLDKRLGK